MGPIKLMRIRWEGEEVDSGVYDPASRVTATLEFDRNMKKSFQLLKNSEWALLVPERTASTGSTRAMPDII